MPRNPVVSVGILWGRSGRRICGISVGHAEGLRRLTCWSFIDLALRLPGDRARRTRPAPVASFSRLASR